MAAVAEAAAPVAFNELDIKDFFEGYYYPFSNGIVTQSFLQKFFSKLWFKPCNFKKLLQNVTDLLMLGKW